jgi:hypothetical protein
MIQCGIWSVLWQMIWHFVCDQGNDLYFDHVSDLVCVKGVLTCDLVIDPVHDLACDL